VHKETTDVAFSDGHHNIEDDGSASRAVEAEEEKDSKLARQIARGTEIDKAVRAALSRSDERDEEGERVETLWVSTKKSFSLYVGPNPFYEHCC
jgi:hypothetical protein